MNAVAAAVEFIRARDTLAVTDWAGRATSIDVQNVHDTAVALDHARLNLQPAEELVPTPINPDHTIRLPVHERITYLRRCRAMGREVFAGLIGRSLSWVEKAEHGHRNLDSVVLLTQIAGVLRVDPALLLTAPTVVLWRHDCGTALAVAAARKPRLCSVCGIGRRGTWCQVEQVAA